MGMKKGQKQYGKEFTAKIMHLHYTEHYTLRETASQLNADYRAVCQAVNRENSRQRKLQQGVLPKRRRGRPSSKPITTIEELQKRNKELEIENELLKKYHEELRR